MGHTSALDAFLTLHKDQLLSSGIPQHYWSTLNDKILNQTFNAGNAFQLLQIDYERARKPHEFVWGLQATCDLPKTDPKHIYLIDHCWTFRVGHAKNQLLQFDSLRNRLCSLLGLESTSRKEDLAEVVFDNVWKLCNTYSIANAEKIEDSLPVWYVMDEIGSAVMHCDVPNCRIVPFVYVNEQITYSLLFPIEDIEAGDFMLRDFAEGTVDAAVRTAALLPWVPHSFKDVGFKPKILGPTYYLGGHVEESLPKISNKMEARPIKEVYKVYTEYSLIKTFLTDKRFELVDNETDADILWYTKHFRDYSDLSDSPEKYVNQFPFEYVITVKDLFCLTCRRASGTNSVGSPDWLPITFNLNTEVANFVSYFQHKEEQGLKNYWIIKPYNLARSLDIHITDNLNYIMRLPGTGMKIAQEYIINPVLFHRPECDGLVKFDVRYVILLKSVKPLQAYIHKAFYLRFANKPFELRDFHVFEKHFTVMNYDENAVLKHMLCSEFQLKWDQQYPNHKWGDIEKDILNMLKKIFECATEESPPCGIAHNPQSRALYAADIMLEWTDRKEIQPKILEINWIPDCKRACDYYPNFYNDIFSLLFLDEVPDVFIEL